MSRLEKTLLISSNTLKENSVLNANVDMKLVTPSIQYIQDTVLQGILGTRLYRELQRQVYDNDVKPEYAELLDDHIESILIYGVLSDVPVSLFLKLMNLSVGTSADEGLTSGSLKQVNFLREHYRQKMQFYMKRMDDFLCFNTRTYPEFLAGKEDDMRPSREPYQTGIAGLTSDFGKRYDRYGRKLPARWRYRDLQTKL